MIYNWLGANFVPSIVTYSLAFAVLLVGSVTDLKTREVPDWVNYGLIISGIGLNLLFSIIYQTDSFIINSIIGLAIFFGISYFMFYLGQWGGGDSKMLMGLGAVIGVDLSMRANQFLFGFFINALFAGAVYGLLWSMYLAFKNKSRFLKETKKVLLKENVVKFKKIILIATVLLLILFVFVKIYYIRLLILLLAFMVLVTFYLWIFVKAIEKSSMYKLVEPSKLTEGDWIVNDIKSGKEYVAGPKDLGIAKKQISDSMKK